LVVAAWWGTSDVWSTGEARREEGCSGSEVETALVCTCVMERAVNHELSGLMAKQKKKGTGGGQNGPG
jgi:hypothetical protein